MHAQGENSTVIQVEVRADATPELAERHLLSLLQVRTLSDFIAPGSGAAILDPQASMATLTIRASDNPHGEVAFQNASLFTDIQEGLAQQLTIIRQFGTFGELIVTGAVLTSHDFTVLYAGTIVVTYRAEAGRVGALETGVSLATAGMDFMAEEQMVTLEDGQQSAVISIPTTNVRKLAS